LAVSRPAPRLKHVLLVLTSLLFSYYCISTCHACYHGFINTSLIFPPVIPKSLLYILWHRAGRWLDSLRLYPYPVYSDGIFWAFNGHSWRRCGCGVGLVVAGAGGGIREERGTDAPPCSGRWWRDMLTLRWTYMFRARFGLKFSRHRNAVAAAFNGRERHCASTTLSSTPRRYLLAPHRRLFACSNGHFCGACCCSLGHFCVPFLPHIHL